MDWLYHILYGFISGSADILPVSAPAHQRLFDVMIPDDTISAFTRLMVHIAIFAALYYNCNNQLIRIGRAVKLARIPKRRRKRPLDTKSLMELQMLKTMAIPLIVGFIFYSKAVAFVSTLIIMSVILLVNGLILYIPQYLPGSNKDSRNLSRVEGVLMGLGGAASVLPGVSSVGTVFSIGSVCGGEKGYVLNMALLLNIGVTAAHVVWDVIALISGDAGALSFGLVLNYLLAAAAAFGGVYLGIRIVRALSAHMDFFAYYCWGAALFTFILYLNI